ncbi:MAG: MotA/TolQ/ExbB proton channel family protein [Deltaproteobacteria bacterium]|nr:MotA/TolQ/ExbB proton channel family protein [Deltaproteobacteria bacterium]
MQALVGFSLIQQFTKLAMLGAEWVMWLLIALSILSVAFMLERAVLYRRLGDDLEKLAEELRELLRSQDIEGAKARLARSPSPAAMVALAGLNDADRGAEAAEEAMAGATARVKLSLERNLVFLATLGNNAPFIGLLGTVIGIIQAFDALKGQQSTAANAARAVGDVAVAAGPTLDATSRVMGTIAEALVATAIGLLVAIPAVAAFNAFSRKVKSMVSSGETLSHVVLAHLKSKHVAEPIVSKPAEKKAEKPAEKPVEKPAEKKAEKKPEAASKDAKDESRESAKD